MLEKLATGWPKEKPTLQLAEGRLQEGMLARGKQKELRGSLRHLNAKEKTSHFQQSLEMI